MRVTDFRLGTGEQVVAHATDTPAWEPFTDWEGTPLTAVEVVNLDRADGAELQLVRIAAGGHFVMHSSPSLAFCQIIEGNGTLVLPGDETRTYQGPELYIFRPGTLHEWRDITADTLLSVCLVD